MRKRLQRRMPRAKAKNAKDRDPAMPWWVIASFAPESAKTSLPPAWKIINE